MNVKEKKCHMFFLLLIPLLAFLGACQHDYPEISLKPEENELDTVTAPTPHYQPREEITHPEDSPYLRLTIAPVISSPRSRENYRNLISYLSREAERPVELLLRSSHGKITQLLQQEMVDVALLCSASYMEVKESGEYELLAVPQFQGESLYRSYVFSRKEEGAHNIEDLKGETFVFTDPLSFSGSLFPFRLLERKGETPDTYFADHFYSYNPDTSVLAVAEGWITAGAVNSMVYNYLTEENEDFADNLQIIEASSPVGYVPLVASKQLPERLKEDLRETVLEMHKYEAGREALEELRVERFISPEEVEDVDFNKLSKIMGGY